MDVEKHIEYWRTGGREDFEVAQSLLENGHFRHALFFVHLAVEKMLKAHVTRTTQAVPPRIHNLIRLAELAALPLAESQQAFLRTLNLFQLEGRYPDAVQAPINRAGAEARAHQANEVIAWLTAQL